MANSKQDKIRFLANMIASIKNEIDLCESGCPILEDTLKTLQYNLKQLAQEKAKDHMRERHELSSSSTLNKDERN